MIDILVTHNDLDGIGCKWVAREVFPDIHCMPSSYKDCETTLHNALDEEPDMLIVSDVWPGNGASEVLMKRLQQFKGTLIILDHHRGLAKIQQESLSVYGAHVWNSPDMCATALMGAYFQFHTPVVDLINTYDLSGTIEGDAGALNALFWEKSHREMVKIMQRNPFYFTEEEKDLLQELERKRLDYLSSCETDIHNIEGHSIAFVEAEKYTSYVCKNLLKSVENVILFNGESKTVSIRSNEPYALPIAERLGGGGHPKASGVSRYPDKAEVLLACKEVFLNDKTYIGK